MLVRVRVKKSGIWKKTQRNEDGWAGQPRETFAAVEVRAEGGADASEGAEGAQRRRQGLPPPNEIRRRGK